jgi:hypothetical protein
MLNVLTGMLVQKEKKHNNSTSDWALDSGSEINITSMSVQQLTPDRISYFSANQQIFRHPDKARLGVFITAYGRHRIIKFLLEHGMLDKLVQVHTDGFHLTESLTNSPELQRDTELGGLKLEHEGVVHVHHVNKVEILEQ